MRKSRGDIMMMMKIQGKKEIRGRRKEKKELTNKMKITSKTFIVN